MSESPPWFGHLLRPELAALRSYVPMAAPPDAIRLDANESAYELDPDDRARLTEALGTVALRRYPDVRCTRLRELVAERHGAHPDQVVVGAGSDEVIAMILNALARPPMGHERASVLFPDPSFVMYRMSALAHGIDPVAIPLDAAWDLDVDAFAQSIAARSPSTIFLPSPNNPTGNLFSTKRIEAVIQSAPKSLVILDEAYGAFAGTTYRDLRLAHPNVGQLQTLSKFGLAAVRVGWAILPTELAVEVHKVRQPYNVNALSQRAAELALTELAPSFDAMVQRTVTERGSLTAALKSIAGVTDFPSAANFVWVSMPVSAADVYDALFKRGIVVRSFHAAGPRLAHMIRITVGTPDENTALVTALREILHGSS